MYIGLYILIGTVLSAVLVLSGASEYSFPSVAELLFRHAERADLYATPRLFLSENLAGTIVPRLVLFFPVVDGAGACSNCDLLCFRFGV